MGWPTEPTSEFDAWFDDLDETDQQHVIAATQYLEQNGPAAKMPLSYPIKQPNNCGMKELRPASAGRTEFRILYAFDFRRKAILLLGGDKSGNWNAWYDKNVPLADGYFTREVKKARERDTRAQKPTTKPKRRRGRRNH